MSVLLVGEHVTTLGEVWEDTLIRDSATYADTELEHKKQQVFCNCGGTR